MGKGNLSCEGAGRCVWGRRLAVGDARGDLEQWRSSDRLGEMDMRASHAGERKNNGRPVQAKSLGQCWEQALWVWSCGVGLMAGLLDLVSLGLTSLGRPVGCLGWPVGDRPVWASFWA